MSAQKLRQTCPNTPVACKVRFKRPRLLSSYRRNGSRQVVHPRVHLRPVSAQIAHWRPNALAHLCAFISAIGFTTMVSQERTPIQVFRASGRVLSAKPAVRWQNVYLADVKLRQQTMSTKVCPCGRTHPSYPSCVKASGTGWPYAQPKSGVVAPNRW